MEFLRHIFGFNSESPLLFTQFYFWAFFALVYSVFAIIMEVGGKNLRFSLQNRNNLGFIGSTVHRRTCHQYVGTCVPHFLASIGIHAAIYFNINIDFNFKKINIYRIKILEYFRAQLFRN